MNTQNKSKMVTPYITQEQFDRVFPDVPAPSTNLQDELREALKDMCAEFLALDLPYGSKAYSRATAALNSAPSSSITDKQVAIAIDTWFSKEYEYNSSM